MNDYWIKYNIHLKDSVVYDKEMIVKNCGNRFFAHVKLEDRLKRNHGNNFVRMEVLQTVDADVWRELSKMFQPFKK